MSEDANFLSRWARRKAEVQESEAAQATAAQETAERDQPEELDDRDRPVTEEEIAALPDPDSLEHGADFKPFLRPGIPQALRQRALRRIWRVNPAIGFLDGMNEYDLDYTDAATVVDNLKTAYQVGRGFVIPEGEEAPAEAGEAATTPQSGEELEERGVSAVDSDKSSDEGLQSTVTLSEDTPPKEDEDPAASSNDMAVLRDEPEPKDTETIAAPLPGRQPGQAAARRWVRFSVSKEGSGAS